jgi:Phage tail assembly chaperone protein
MFNQNEENTLYALIKDGKPLKYPYSFDDLRDDNPNVSFYENPTIEDLHSWGLFPVEKVTSSFDISKENAIQSLPIFRDGKWYEHWNIVSISDEEIEQRYQNLSQYYRQERNKKLFESDYTQLIDSPVVNKEEWKNYRTQLRDITKQENFPWQVMWPKSPTQE